MRNKHIKAILKKMLCDDSRKRSHEDDLKMPHASKSLRNQNA